MTAYWVSNDGVHKFGGRYDDIPADVEPKDIHTKTRAAQILELAASLIDGERDKQHGDREDCHAAIAALWSGYLAVEIKPFDVALMMALLKIARTQNGIHNQDSYVDAAGYIGIAGELANDHGC